MLECLCTMGDGREEEGLGFGGPAQPLVEIAQSVDGGLARRFVDVGDDAHAHDHRPRRRQSVGRVYRQRRHRRKHVHAARVQQHT